MSNLSVNKTIASLKDEILRISKLEKLEREFERKKFLKKYDVRAPIFDEYMGKETNECNEKNNCNVLFPDIEPYEGEVDLRELLNLIVVTLKKYLLFDSEHEPRAISLWIIHTYCLDAAYISPILFITSPEMRSGKSTLFAILEKTTFQCVSASSISPSVIYRIISKYHPTLLCDEADTYLTEKHEELRGILNAGHSRDTAKVLRTDPDTLEPEIFNAFGAKAIAAIRGIPGTIEDRAITIKMRRKPKNVIREKLRLIDPLLRKSFDGIKSKCIKFSLDNVHKLKEIIPVLPSELHDRAADNWYSLFQIATFAGKEWIELTNAAALHLSGTEQEHKSLGIELLEDISNLFDGKFKNANAVTTSELIDSLCSDEDSPWATYNLKRQDTKILPRQLSKLLSPYGIKPANNIGIRNQKGYIKEHFKNAFVYIPSEVLDFDATAAISAQPQGDRTSKDNEEKNLSAPTAASAQNNEEVEKMERKEAVDYKSEEIPEPAPVMALADKAEIASESVMLDACGIDYMDL